MISIGGALTLVALVYLYVSWKRDEEDRYQRLRRERDERKLNDTDIRHRD